ncbi:heat shock protein Hsp20 domain-containing protein [Heterostelium album PN500]|uniref:Heat shock protein Hsp20 domain-containing protein n=1 Tax=Heterostelium pallidum (strain ATCC 26659 / Pp 5 / PN500) TaxID=670386 RepID=D3BHK6_HETP5|nr:heat shock protein Hsp20 domain-containing protein [Heterostelium album PN500]EFA79183.1 heat shock protein Hsp20 domain-containing protein [Heterostelium album PN500]|eukprot:XP_020431304.1 heat shock protein Hsp20 domain-containing protein [Heterostelium album PN500]
MSATCYSPYYNNRFTNNHCSKYQQSNYLQSLLNELLSTQAKENVQATQSASAPVQSQSTSPKEWTPKADYQLEEDLVTLQLELPGVKKEHITIDIKESTLTITGEKKDTIANDEKVETSSSSPSSLVGEDSPRLEEDNEEVFNEKSDSPTNNPDTLKKKRVINHTEIVYGKFKRVFQLPKDIDLQSATAKLQDGILRFTIKRILPEPPKSIKIQIN